MLALPRPRDSWQLICIYIDIRWSYIQGNSSWCVSWHSSSVSWVRPHSSNANVSHLFFLLLLFSLSNRNHSDPSHFLLSTVWRYWATRSTRSAARWYFSSFQPSEPRAVVPVRFGLTPLVTRRGNAQQQQLRKRKKRFLIWLTKSFFFHPAGTIDWSTFDSVEFNFKGEKKSKKRKEKKKNQIWMD